MVLSNKNFSKASVHNEDHPSLNTNICLFYYLQQHSKAFLCLCDETLLLSVPSYYATFWEVCYKQFLLHIHMKRSQVESSQVIVVAKCEDHFFQIHKIYYRFNVPQRNTGQLEIGTYCILQIY